LLFDAPIPALTREQSAPLEIVKLDQSEGTGRPDKTVELYQNYSNWSNPYHQDDQLRIPEELSPIHNQIGKVSKLPRT
jgi:hypothetical protein